MPLIPDAKVNSYPQTVTPEFAGDIVFDGIVNTFYIYPDTLPAGTYNISWYTGGAANTQTVLPIFFNDNNLIVENPTGANNGTNIVTIDKDETKLVLSAATIAFPKGTTGVVSDGTTIWAGGASSTLANYVKMTNTTYSEHHLGGTDIPGATTMYYNGNTTEKYFLADGLTNGILYTSTDGTTWNKRTTGMAALIRDVAANNNVTNKYVVIGGISSGVYTSTDAITWTSRTSNLASGNPTTVATNGTTSTNYVYVIGGSSGSVVYSTDGVTWANTTSISATAATSINKIAYLNGAYWAVQGNASAQPSRIWTSTDGLTWTEKYSDSVNRGSSYFSIGYVNGYYMAGPPLVISTDGNTWLKIGHTVGVSLTGKNAYAYLNNNYFMANNMFYPTYYQITKIPNITTLS